MVIHGPQCPQAVIETDDPDMAGGSIKLEGREIGYGLTGTSWIEAYTCQLVAGPHTWSPR
jgi:hypothetical protein